MMEGFVRPSVDEVITGDRWGYFLSGYSPLKSGVGQYLVGIDMYADRCRTSSSRSGWRVLLSLAFSLLLAAIFSSLLSRSFTRRIRNLSQRFTAVTRLMRRPSPGCRRRTRPAVDVVRFHGDPTDRQPAIASTCAG